MKKSVAVVILAGGMGTRMKSEKAKVLHEVQGRPMILYVVEAAREIAGDDIVVVIGNQARMVREIVSQTGALQFAYQEKQLGTGHAVLCALPHVPEHCEHVVILCGDAPLIMPETIRNLVAEHFHTRCDASLLAVELENPAGYGRILLDADNQVVGIIEEADATGDQRQIKLINSGIYCVRKQFLADALPDIAPNNAQGEIYLTDIISIGYKNNKRMGLVICDNCQQILGINSCEDLKAVDAIMRTRLRIIS
jgi:UDP-N-acetylglucosamine diphosphorylase/glucosamine-1-phosphate N-acetyltransferase